MRSRCFGRCPDGRPRRAAHGLEWTTLPLFIAFPDAACVASAQSLTRARLSMRHARIAALGVAAVAAVMAPFAALLSGCGLAGACR